MSEDQKLLVDVRDLLLPALRIANSSNSGIDFDIQVDFITGTLLVRGYNHKTELGLGFPITRLEIVDGVYKDTFKGKLAKLVAALTSPTIAKIARETAQNESQASNVQ